MPINTKLFPGNNKTTKEGFKKWLDEVSKYASDPDYDPILLPKKVGDQYVNEDGSPYKEFDYLGNVPDFERLQDIGDKRFSLGHMLSSAFDKYLPRILLYNEIAQAGGCQVIGEYICDSDGVPIKKVESPCPLDSDLEMIPEDIVDFVRNKFSDKVSDDVSAFVQFLRINYINKGYKLELITLKDIPLFFAKLINIDLNITKYFRYYWDDRNLVSSLSRTPIKEVVVSRTTNDVAMIDASRVPIPLYNKNLTI